MHSSSMQIKGMQSITLQYIIMRRSTSMHPACIAACVAVCVAAWLAACVAACVARRIYIYIYMSIFDLALLLPSICFAILVFMYLLTCMGLACLNLLLVFLCVVMDSTLLFDDAFFYLPADNVRISCRSVVLRIYSCSCCLT